MCGIFGVLYRDGETVPDEALLRDTLGILGHRGPDSAGIFNGSGIGLAHTRLSLLDLSSRGNQPFWDEAHRYALVYNGEIYNFRSLRSELEGLGLSFHTTSDTEVLLQGIIRYGLDAFLPRLEGMFAFALWDSEQGILSLVRDRFGIKPLSVYESDRMLVFASEVKAIAPWVSLSPDPFIATAYLSGFGGPTRDRSFFQNIAPLSPGTICEIRQGGRSTARSFFHITDFWNPEERDRLQRIDPSKVVDTVEQLLLTSVEKHLIADAPVGALCSGGLDSSLVMAMAARFHSNLAIFHADVRGPLSEFAAARTLANHLHLDLAKVDVQDQDFIEHLPTVIAHYEYPFSYHPNSIPFLLVSRLVRASGVKAILSGEGSDECFLGYSPIAFEDLRRNYRRLLLRMRNLVHRIPKLGKAIWPIDGAYSSLIAGLQQNFEIALDHARIEQRIQQTKTVAGNRELRSLEWLGHHLRTLLHRNDALGMAASIEARFPYLDHDVVRTAVNLPYKYKIRASPTAFDRSHPFLRDKWIVRKVAERYLPFTLSQRRKLGFPVNAYERMRVSKAFFNDGFVADLFRLGAPTLEYLLANAEQQLKVRLTMLEVWGRSFIMKQRDSALLSHLLHHASIAPLA
jgi:asparagine synthase (glutamine-hydrolysing)